MNQEVSLDEKEYKKLSLNFRKIASRFLNTNYAEADSNLARFLAFIDETPVIYEFIKKNIGKSYDLEELIANRGYHGKFQLPLTASEEIGFIYQLLSYVNNSHHTMYDVSIGYNVGRTYQEASDNFNHLVVKPLVDHVVSYLGEMAIDMELDKRSTTQFNIGDFKGQLNHAEGQAKITANQTYNEANIQELKDVAQKFAKALMENNSISTSDKEDTLELVEAAVQEIENEKPKKIILRTAIENVKNIKEIATTGTALYTFGGQLLSLIQPLI